MTASDRELERIRTAVGDDTFDARYTVGSEVGRGGMGIVYRAIERATGRAVAIKVLPDDVRDHARFFAETAILERMSHPAIVAYVGHGVTSEGQPYLAMEWLDGESVAQRLTGGKLAVAAAVAIGARVAGALAHAHGQHVLHRDIKPSNVLLVGGAPERAVLIDFGVAKDQVATTMTQAGQLVGTPHYMAPEQVVGKQKLDGRADLFGVGCLLHECLTGVAPFGGDELIEILAQVLMRDPPPLRDFRDDVPPRLAALVDVLLAKKPEDRIAEAARVAAELETIAAALASDDRAALDEIPPHLDRHSAPPRGAARPGEAGDVDRAVTVDARPPPRRRRAWPWIVGGASGVAILGGIAMVLFFSGTPGPAPRGEVARALPCRDTAGPDCVARCVAGDAAGCVSLGELWGRSDREALPLFDRACALGNALGCFRAGFVRSRLKDFDPISYPRSAAEASWQRACDLGHSASCTHLAEIFLKDSPPDRERARSLYVQACALDDKSACKRAGQLR